MTEEGQDPAAVRRRVADIDARIAALRAEGFSQDNVTLMAALIGERDRWVQQMEQFADAGEEGGRPG